jgi:hypothetical protein
MAPLFSAGADSATVVPPWGSAVFFCPTCLGVVSIGQHMFQ